MNYQEHRPSPVLQDFVECIWTLSSDTNAFAQPRLILPDGCSDIIFNFGKPLTSSGTSGEHVNTYKSFIVGNMTKALLSKPQSNCDLLAVRFKPAGMFSFIEIPLKEFTNRVVDLGLSTKHVGWQAQLCELTPAERITKLQQLLLSVFKPSVSREVLHGIRLLKEQNGLVRATALCNKIGISQKQLERLFQNYVGISPKQMARVNQFQLMVKLLKNKGEESLLALATDGGYTDHAHFTNSFKDLSGVTPTTFIKAYL